MKVTVIDRVYDSYREALEIQIDGRCVFDVHDGEPEDNTLARNFQACTEIPDLLHVAWAAGKTGEPFSIEFKKGDQEDYE